MTIRLSSLFGRLPSIRSILLVLGALLAFVVAPIARAVGSNIEVLMDGGIRSGQDVIKALALGAKGVFIGRAFVYGLGAMGEAGVTNCLEIIRNELDITMAFCGVRDVKRLPRDGQHSG